MYPWRRILVPTDFSTAAKWAFDAAIRAAASTGAEIIILHVRIPRVSGELTFDSSVYDYAEQHELDVLRNHAKAVQAHVSTRRIVRVSADPAAAILKCAKEEDADLVVLSTHARHHVAHLLIGSTTLRVLGSCTVPVLAVRYGVKPADAVKRIAVIGDSDAVQALAGAIGRQEGAEIARVADADDINADLVVMASECNAIGELTKQGAEIVRHADAAVLVVPSP
jgi:nucleotide-binding universal stress UspA family protein